MGSVAPSSLPDKSCPLLHLTHPTLAEKYSTWHLNSVNWGGAIGTPAYLEREAYLTTVPLAANGGVTHWILTSSSLPENKRPILASCESLRKRAFVSNGDGGVKEVITHGIGSVFCNPDYRGKGYAVRMLKELAPVLKEWQTKETGKEAPFSFLYSDIGTKFYARLGWAPFPSTHVAFPPSYVEVYDPDAQRLQLQDIKALCVEDERRIRKQLESAKDGKIRVALVPDHDQMLWHHKREDFLTSELFNRTPFTRGAIAGPRGSRIWAIWTRSYYRPLATEKSGNTLHILRLVVENESPDQKIRNAVILENILEIAQQEATLWQLVAVELWNPTSYVQGLIEEIGLQHTKVEREEESIASLMWYGDEKVEEIEWIGNEKYGWC